ncbi:MAG: T9SS type A sorting domain-containing protein [Bacteroidota bacterium]
MQRFLTALCGALLLSAAPAFAQQTGLFQTYAIIDQTGAGDFYAGGLNADNAPLSFSGTNFAEFSSSSVFLLDGGEVKTFKNGGGDVFGATLFYRVYETANGPGPIGFSEMDLPFNEDNVNGVSGDQKWQAVNQGVDLVAACVALPATDCTLEVFWRAETNLGDRFDNNGGANYTATFAVTPDAVFNYDAQTLVDNGVMDFARISDWPDIGPLGLTATTGGKNARRPRLYATFAPVNDQPVVHFNGTKTGLAIPKADELFGSRQPEKSIVFGFTTGNSLTGRQVLFELGGEESGLNAYLDGNTLYVGGWVQAGLSGDWGPFFASTTVTATTFYSLIINHRRATGNTPGQLDIILDGQRLQLFNATNTFAATSDNGGIGRITKTTRFHDRVSNAGELAFAKANVGKFVHYNVWLTPERVDTEVSALLEVYGSFGEVATNPVVTASSEAAVPEATMLASAYPNPFAVSTTIRYGLAQASDVSLAVYDVTGRQVATLVRGVQEAGWNEVAFDARGLASGVYLVRLVADGVAQTRRIVVS